ncbi:MAG: CoA transferase, partial [Dehalococcoidia bacterium]
GLAIAWGVCGALFARERTGKGQKIEAALLATALAVQSMRFLRIKGIDEEAQIEFLEDLANLRSAGCLYPEVQAHYEALRPRPPGFAAYYRTYQTKDSVIAVGCLSDSLRKKMADALELRDIRFEPGYDPFSDEAREFAEVLTKKAEALFLEKTTDEWVRILDAAGVPCGPVKYTEELMEDEQVIANDMVVELEHSVVGPLKMVGPILRMSETPLKAKSASPALGQHTDEILTALGYGPDEVKRLREEGVTL